MRLYFSLGCIYLTSGPPATCPPPRSYHGPCNGMRVIVADAATGAVRGEATTDVAGRAHFTLPPGRYRATASFPSPATASNCADYAGVGELRPVTQELVVGPTGRGDAAIEFAFFADNVGRP